jgi:hypothetical protein
LFTPWRGTFRATGNLNETRSDAAGAPAGLDGALVLAGGRNNSLHLDSSKLYRFATVRTDKDEYALGETVTVTGSGWQPGERVTLALQALPKAPADRTVTVTADPSGNISSGEYQQGVPGKYVLTAAGSGSEAQLKFSSTAASLSQCQDGVGLTPASEATATCSWVNGNATPSPNR